MSYKSQKGKRGEYEFGEFLTEALKRWGYRFKRVGNPEKNKISLFGDVVIDKTTDRQSKCFLQRYFLEVKNHASPDLWAIMREAEENANKYNKHGAIAYVIKQKAKEGQRGGNMFLNKGERLIVMMPETFKRIICELQGFINGE